MTNFNKYLAMESTLEIINAEYISLSKEEMEKNNEILHELLDKIIHVLKSDNLFRALYQDNFFGGSYYDGLKIRRPDEYDICLKLTFPKPCVYQVIPSSKDGFVHVQFSQIKKRSRRLRNKWLGHQRPYYGVDNLHKIIGENGCLDANKLMLWMHQILSTWLEGEKRGNARINWIDTSYGKLKIKLRRHGPAFTFRITNFEGILINFDLVPSFLFGENHWPTGYRRESFSERPQFYIVPKYPDNIKHNTLYFRTSFQEQDKVIIHSTQRLKPALRLIKKLKDKLQPENVIVSYFIKNIFLWQVLKRNPTFWDRPLSYIFVTMLEEFYECVKQKTILYFWNPRYNLLQDRDTSNNALERIRDKLAFIVSEIKNNPDEEFLVAKYLLSRAEMKQFRREHMTVIYDSEEDEYYYPY